MERYPRYDKYFLSTKTAIRTHLLEIKEHYEEVNLLKAHIAELEKQLDVAV